MRDRQIDNRNEALGLKKTLDNEEIIQDIREKELQERQQKEGAEVLNKQEKEKVMDEEKRKEQYQGSRNEYYKKSNKKIDDLRKNFKVQEIYKSDLREKISPHLTKFTKEKYIYSVNQPGRETDLKISLTRGQIGTLYEIGRFSVIQKRDFLKHDYRNFKALNYDIKHLLKHNLIKVNVSYTQKHGRIETLSLTQKGEQVLRQLGVIREGEKIYSGKIRQREQVYHDSKLYSVFQKRAKEILERGGKNIRVYLDRELKEKLNREIQRLKNEERKTLEEAKKIASEKMSLPVVNGKVVLPDMQIEYETRDGETARANIEFATKDYRGDSIKEKATAGFDIYASKDDAPKLEGYLSGGGDNTPLGKPKDWEIFTI